MSRHERYEIIKQIETLRKSPLICYVNGDRENVGTRVAPDALRIFYEHLEELGGKHHDNIDLFVYTRGGDVLTPWRLVNLLREYTSRLTVLIPFRCYSAGTLIALGADEIIMSKMGELGPIDPSVANAFNPQDPINANAKIPISVEDVSAYFALARELAGIVEPQEMIKVVELLSNEVHPLALGNVYRNYVLIRSLAHRLLSLHMDESMDQRKQDIINNLTEKLYAHNHLISSREAREDIGLPVKSAGKKEEKLLWQLFTLYEKDLELRKPFNPSMLLELNQQEVTFEVSGGLIESSKRLDSFVFHGIVKQNRMKGEQAPSVNILRQGWEKINIWKGE